MPTNRTKDHEHAWSVADFESEREHMTKFVRDDIIPLLNDDKCRRVLIRAPVKSGKREIVEYLAQRDNAIHSGRVHVFTSAWHRIADTSQRKELELHNMKVFSMTSNSKADDCVHWIQTQIKAGKSVVIHLDECDFGSGARQIMGRVYITFRENDSVTFLLYSATPQEVLFSGEVDEKGEEEFEELVEEIRQKGASVEYVPPEGYCGPARFLKEGLVFEAQSFFTIAAGGRNIQLSPQGKQIVTNYRAALLDNPRRNILVLRLSGSDGKGKKDKHIYQFLRNVSNCRELDGIDIVVSKNEKDLEGNMGRVQTEPIQWSNRTYWDRLTIGRPMIYVIDQTASRSTEFACHDRIFAYHDFRNTAVYTTRSQAQERLNHYTQRYDGFQPIRIYGHKKTFQLSAGLIDYATYMTNPWQKRKVYKQDTYLIKSTEGNTTHPDHPQPMSKDEADRVLQELASFVEVKVSDRVKGKIKTAPVFGCKFEACTPQALAGPYKKGDFKNPFIESEKRGQIDGRWQGHLREWGVHDYQHIENNKGWGLDYRSPKRITICYKDGILGIAVRWINGECIVNTLQTSKSMYHP